MRLLPALALKFEIVADVPVPDVVWLLFIVTPLVALAGGSSGARESHDVEPARRAEADGTLAMGLPDTLGRRPPPGAA